MMQAKEDTCTHRLNPHRLNTLAGHEDPKSKMKSSSIDLKLRSNNNRKNNRNDRRNNNPHNTPQANEPTNDEESDSGSDTSLPRQRPLNQSVSYGSYQLGILISLELVEKLDIPIITLKKGITINAINNTKSQCTTFAYVQIRLNGQSKDWRAILLCAVMKDPSVPLLIGSSDLSAYKTTPIPYAHTGTSCKRTNQSNSRD